MDWTRAMEALAGFGPLENAAGELEQIAADEERAMDARIAALIELVELGERARAAKLACALLGRLVESADVARAVVVTELLTSALRAKTAARSARLGGVTGSHPRLLLRRVRSPITVPAAEPSERSGCPGPAGRCRRRRPAVTVDVRCVPAGSDAQDGEPRREKPERQQP